MRSGVPMARYKGYLDSAMRAMPAVCELDGPDMIGPRESNRLSSRAD